MFGDQPREWLYGEYGEAAEATRMVRDHRDKLIYYAYGNRMQLFDLQEDPCECRDLAGSADHAEIRAQLTELLATQRYGNDDAFYRGDELVGVPLEEAPATPDRTLSLQRGRHWPVPPQS